MEYEVGDKVIVRDGIKSYVVEIENIYLLYGFGYVYDGMRLFDKENVTFRDKDVECKIKKEEFNNKEVEEEKKYLKTWEATKKHKYDSFNIDLIKYLKGQKYLIDEKSCTTKIDFEKENQWEISRNQMINKTLNKIEELIIKKNERKEIPKEFEGLKYILGSINNMDCDDKDCDKCPLGMEKCDMLDEIFFDMKEKYNF